MLKELGGWASMQMVLRYAHLDASHTEQWVHLILRCNLATLPLFWKIAFGRKPLLYLVGRERLERSTYGLRVRCSTN